MLPNSFPNYFGKLGYDGFEEEHELITERLRKTLYYGKNPTTDRPSLPLTEIAVEFFNEAAPRELGKLDTYMASSSSRQTCMSPCSMMMGMLYIKRLRRQNMDYLHKTSSSDLFLISVMMASKFMYDEGVDDEVFNDEWAAAADIETEEVNELERQFLSAIDWKLFISNQEFEQILKSVEKRIALSQGLDRGWYSYTDLWILSQDIKFLKLLNDVSGEISKVIIATTLAYIAGILVMVGSTLLVTCMSATIVSLGPLLPLSSHLSPTTVPKSVVSVMSNSNNSHEFGNRLDAVVDEQYRKEAEKEVETMPTEVSADPPTTPQENVDTSNILSQLWAVVTLRDSYLDFLRVVSDTYMFSSVKNFGRTQNGNEEILCAEGPCLQNARKDCQNITEMCAGFSRQLFSGHCSNCINKQHPGRRGSLHHGYVPFAKEKDVYSTDYGQESFSVKCCCSSNYNTVDVLDPGSLLKTFSDISLGFITGLHNTPWPIGIKT